MFDNEIELYDNRYFILAKQKDFAICCSKQIIGDHKIQSQSHYRRTVKKGRNERPVHVLLLFQKNLDKIWVKSRKNQDKIWIKSG